LPKIAEAKKADLEKGKGKTKQMQMPIYLLQIYLQHVI